MKTIEKFEEKYKREKLVIKNIRFSKFSRIGKDESRKCYKLNYNSYCSLDKINYKNVDTNYFEDKKERKQSDIMYCPVLAKKLLNHEIEDDICIYKEKGKYFINDGRHRICILKKLKTKEWEFTIIE